MDIFKKETLQFYRGNEVKNHCGSDLGRTGHRGLEKYKRLARKKARKKKIKNFQKSIDKQTETWYNKYVIERDYKNKWKGGLLMKHTVLLIDCINPEDSSILIVDDKQKELLKEVFDFFGNYDNWVYTFIEGTDAIQDFTKE